VTPQRLFGPGLWKLVLACVVKPASVGFNISDVDIMKNLPQEVGCSP